MSFLGVLLILTGFVELLWFLPVLAEYIEILFFLGELRQGFRDSAVLFMVFKSFSGGLLDWGCGSWETNYFVAIDTRLIPLPEADLLGVVVSLFCEKPRLIKTLSSKLKDWELLWYIPTAIKLS